MITIDRYNLEITPGTRNHKGCFVQDTHYTLIEVDRSGWALICRNQATCHYVDPDRLQEIPNQNNLLSIPLNAYGIWLDAVELFRLAYVDFGELSIAKRSVFN